ncbi:MAG: MBOAT family protein [Clostridia bacterium]|nr:MBOAT family protein [Clostridia bacterium]
MSVLSVSFISLLAGVFIVYYLFPQRHRWIVLLCASLIFYLAAGAGSLVYMLITSAATYAAALGMQRLADRQKAHFKANKLSREEKAAYRKTTRKKRKACLLAALAVDLGLLCFFKYYHFALEQFNIVAGWFGSAGMGSAMRLIVPLGISFYTFQSVGYLADVYGENTKPQTNYFRLLLFISFFPQITQGPISTYEHLSQTLYDGKTPDEKEVIWGFQRLIWGFMKKMVIANTLAQNTAVLFENYAGYAGVSVLLGAFLYLIQLYADFSGYMDIMCGFCQMLGIRLTENFNQPFLAKSISEYWRRWHISLGQWFRKYVYFPIGVSSWNLKLAKFSREKLSKHAASCLPPTMALLVTWSCTGIWHGASWGYIIWGLLNGAFIIASLWLAPLYERTRAILRIQEDSRFWNALRIARTFTIVALLEVLPEVGTLSDGFRFWGCIVANWRMPASLAELIPFVYLQNFNKTIGFCAAMGCVLLLLIASVLKQKKAVRAYFNDLPVWVQVMLLSALIMLTASFGIQASWGAEGFMYANF